MQRENTPQSVNMLAVLMYSLHRQEVAVTGAAVVSREQGRSTAQP